MINWQSIDTVLLDMDGTLLDLHFDNYFWAEHLPKRYAEIHGESFDRVQERLAAQIAAEEGRLQWYCLDFWSETLSLDICALKAEVQHKIQVRPYVEEFLGRLRGLGKKVVLVTNAHRAGMLLKFESTQLDQWLDLVVSSHDYQQPKEAQAFWQQLALQLPFDPARTLFIDDTVRVLDSARQYGIAHLLAIHQPDSQIERYINQYPAIRHFDEIMPPEADQSDG